MKTTEEYAKDIRRALKKAHRYSAAIESQIVSLAGALRTLAIANNDIDGLTCTTVYETTRYGEKLAPHPAFKVQRDAQDSVTRQMKALGLTAADLIGENETDPMIMLTQEVRDAVRPEIVKPDDGGGER